MAALLHDDNFTLADDGRGKGTRFTATIIVKAIARIFFHSGSMKTLGRLEHTSKAFMPLRGETVVFISVCIGFALAEYSAGKRVGVKFEGSEVNILQIWIQRTWDEQSSLKQEVVLGILNKRVKEQAGFEDGQIKGSYQAATNPYKDSFEDMADCIDELPPDLRQRV